MTERKQEIFLWMVTVVLIGVAMLLPAFANEVITITKKGHKEYMYPHEGREFSIGPEKAHYYVLHFDGDGEPLYGEVVRIADDFVLMRVYPDETTEEFTPPPLTKEQIEKFDKKYNPVEVEKEINKEEKKWVKKLEDEYRSLVGKNYIKQIKGDNYWVFLYTEASKENLKHLSSVFSEVNYSNTYARPYNFSTKKARNHIVSKLKKANLTIPLQVSVVPFRCDQYPEGLIQYRTIDGQDVIQILVFHSRTVSAEKQFDIQFKKYLQAAKATNE